MGWSWGSSSAAAGLSSPLSLPSLHRWNQASDLASLSQDDAGATAVTTHLHPVGRWMDKSGGARHITQPTAGVRPEYRTDTGYSSVRFAAKYLFDSSPGLYAAGACSVFFSIACVSTPGTSKFFFAETSHSSDFPVYGIETGSIATSMGVLIRNNANVAQLNNSTFATDVFTAQRKVIGVTDNGSQLIPYVNGVAGTPVSYTRVNPLTATRFTIGGLLRTSFGSSMNNVDVYEFVATLAVLSDTERDGLVNYLGREVGLF